MFKKILLAAVLAATASFAQINVGARVGVDMNTLWGDDAEDIGTSVGFNAGVGLKISLPLLPITLAPEVLIDMRNFSIERSGEDLGVTTWALDIPTIAINRLNKTVFFIVFFFLTKFLLYYIDGEVPFLGQILTFFNSVCRKGFVFLPPK